MDAQEYNPHYIQINELYIDTVVIDDTDFITLWCFTVLDEEYKFVYLGCDFTQFNLILIAAGEKGKEIALHLGFDTASHFSRFFKGKTSLNPSQYGTASQS